jgi:hypothetical protein
MGLHNFKVKYSKHFSDEDLQPVFRFYTEVFQTIEVCERCGKKRESEVTYTYDKKTSEVRVSKSSKLRKESERHKEIQELWRRTL